MIAIDYSFREFFHQLTKVHWEWILATIILTAKCFKARLASDGLSRVESRPHKPKTEDDRITSCDNAETQSVIRNTERATRNTQPETRNSKPCT